MTNQLCSVNLLYPGLTGVAFMYKLRPLDDNPIEHTGLQYARRCSNTESLLYGFVISRVSFSCSLSASLKVNSHHNGKLGLPRPIQILVLYASVSHLYSSRLKTVMLGNAGGRGHPCSWQWVTLHLTSRPAANRNPVLCCALQEGSTVMESCARQIPSGSRGS